MTHSDFVTLLAYGSYKLERTWPVGVVILFLTIATAFTGCALPWGEISFWGATIITYSSHPSPLPQLQLNAGHSLLILELSRSHTTRHHTQEDSSGWVISQIQRLLPNNTQHSQETSMPPAGLEPTFSAVPQPHTYASDRAAAETALRTSSNAIRR